MNAAVFALQQLVDPVAELQKRFALLKIGNQVGLVELPQVGVSWGYSGSVDFYGRADGALLLTRALQNIHSSVETKSAIGDFYASPRTHVFTDIVFDPRPTPAIAINLWRGPTASGCTGTFETLESFLFNVIAGKDVTVFEYVMNFVAHMIQKPEEKPGVMPVLFGGQGTGKGTFFKLLQAIWGRTSICTNQIEQVTGRFNNLLERTYVVCLDEALFVGNRNATDKLKSLITEQQITIEAKHQTPRSIFSCHRLFAATNAEHFAHIDRDDRRMIYLPIPATYQNDPAYWIQVNAALNSAELPALFHHLAHRDISTFNPRQRPKTKALTDQKIKSLTGFDAWWHDLLQDEQASRYLGASVRLNQAATSFVSTADLRSSYEAHAQRGGSWKDRQLSEVALRTRIQRLCPSAVSARKKISGAQLRGYDLPALAKARQEFEAFIGGEVEWLA